MEVQRQALLINEARALGWTTPLPTRLTFFTVHQLEEFIEAATENKDAPIRFVDTGNGEDDLFGGGTLVFNVEHDLDERRIMTLEGLEEAGAMLQDMFKHLLIYIAGRRGVRLTDPVQIAFRDDGPAVSTDFFPLSFHSANDLIHLMHGFASGREYRIRLSQMKIIVSFQRLRRGNGRLRTAQTAEEYVRRKNCFVQTTDRECFYQVVVLAQLYHGDDEKRYKYMCKQQANNTRERLALELRNQCGRLPGVSIGDLPEMEIQLNMSFMMIDHLDKSIAYDTKNPGHPWCFFYRYGDGNATHYAFLKPNQVASIYKNKSYYCYTCMKAFYNLLHPCFELCKKCCNKNCPAEEDPKDCAECHLSFKNQFCYDSHKKKKCAEEKKCVECYRIYKVHKRYVHKCYHYVCHHCDEQYIGSHQCYIQSLSKLKKPSTKYIFYDFECTLDDGVHQVAGAVAMTFDDPTPIEFDSLDHFLQWVFSGEFKGYTFIGHNAGRYDFHFIKQATLQLGHQYETSDVCNGNTTYYSKYTEFDITFIDSYRFISRGLRAFPKIFGLTELKKGFFPYRFFTTDRLDYKGPMPDKSWFDFDGLKEDEQAEGLAWYEEHKNDEIDLYQMCMTYCISDVALLREGCIKFRNLFMDISEQEMDPFRYITIASVCMNLYLRFYYPEKTIARLPQVNDRIGERTWLAAQALERGVNIQPMVGMSGIDEHGVVYRFRYCYDDGCTVCFNKMGFHNLQGIKLHELRYMTDRVVEDHNAVTIWECEWDIPEDSFSPLLNPHDAFFGGRTEPIKLYYKAQPGEKIRYYDYTSLYPAVQSGRLHGLTPDTYNDIQGVEYPVGFPDIYVKDFPPLDQVFGFIKCKITPPDLYLPLLPEKRDGKLMFDNIEKIGTWTSVEIHEALALGYEVKEVYSVWHFKQTTATLFRDYVKTFLKIKQQAGGWAKMGCTTEEEKNEMIAFYEREQGITLDNVGEHNPGLYNIAKICLNSLWGKFAQQPGYVNTKDVFHMDDFEALIQADDKHIKNVVFHKHGVRTVSYAQRKEMLQLPRHSNYAVAAFTTAHARCRLYQALKILNRDVLYMDTDSIIFVERNPVLCTGQLLGDLTDELKNGDYITEFVSVGPKSYGYITHQGKKECKIKGFTLNVETCKVLNVDTLKDLILNNRKRKIRTTPLQFDIDAEHNIVTKKFKEGEGKFFQFTFDKRVICTQQDHMVDTLPYDSA